MVSFFTHLEIYSLLSLLAISFTVVIFAKRMLDKQDNLKKICDLLRHFSFVLFYAGQSMFKTLIVAVAYASERPKTILLPVNIA